jgi:hypothetical protein
MVQQDAAPQSEGEGDRMIGYLGRAVIGDVADKDVPRCGRGSVELVVADAHADDAAQFREAR